MREWAIALCAISAACSADGSNRTSRGPLTAAATMDGDGSSSAASESDADSAAEIGESGVPGECTAGESQTQACAGACGQQERVCTASEVWGQWGVCSGGVGECSPGTAQECGPCMEQTCDAGCTWGACIDMGCAFECQDAARNGSEICDDQGFQMPDGQLFLVCEDDNGGIAYVSNNTGPPQDDGVNRCQGWEDMGLNAWDFLDYVYMMECDEVGKFLEIELPAGTNSHYGVHDNPAGGGHFTQVCIAVMN